MHVVGILLCLACLTSVAQGSGGELYTVATAHLDTQWRWTIQKTIADYIPATMRDNFTLIEKYPHYVFSFEGSFRYQLMQEYYPAEFERLRRHIAAGRWRVTGSWVDAVDTNVPSPESLIRHTLYGNGYFRREFGVTSRDVFLPDCFGFGFALPSIAAHSGLLGFSTQKLAWGSAYGTPFNIGLWEGVDGSVLISALDPQSYVSRIAADLSADSTWIARIALQDEVSGLAAGYKYYGTGDTGGAPTEESVAWLERSRPGEGPLRVRSTGADQLARDLTAGLEVDLAGGLRPELLSGAPDTPARAQLERLPRFRGELLMTDHGVGCYSSQAVMKRWNRKNELLADAAERAAVMADWLGGAAYPRERLRAAWTRFLWHQFHDDLTGTSIPEAYTFSWNDELISLNEFSSVLTHGIGAVTRALDTRVMGIPLIVYNPLAIAREDIVEAWVIFGREVPPAVRVFDPAGREAPAQVIARDSTRVRIAFLARVPSVGLSVYDIRPASEAAAHTTQLLVDRQHIENARYRVTLDGSGDIASIFDKQAECELLAEPLRLQLLDNSPRDWAAWEIDYDDIMAPPRVEVGGGDVHIRVRETGPARAALEVVRECAGSTFTQQIRLAAGGAGDRIEVANEIDWRTPGTLLKAAFPLAVQAAEATYDLGLGTIRRGVNRPALYEVPAQQWADLTAEDGSYGVTILNDCRYGWDRPDERTLRLTLVHTPEVSAGWSWIADQASQDLGRHKVTYALCGHAADWRSGRVYEAAERLNQPLHAFQAPEHSGDLGREFSFLEVSGALPAVAVRAVKLAEESDEVIVRLQELTGRPQWDVHLRCAGSIAGFREVNGAEEPLGPPRTAPGARLVYGELVVHLAPYQPRTFALRLGPAPLRLARPAALPLALPYDIDGISYDEDRTDGDFDGQGRTLAGELLDEPLVRDGIPFTIGPRGPGRANVVACRGQQLALPAGDFNRLYLLAAAVDGDREARFELHDRRGTVGATTFWVQDYAEPIGQWDSRLVGDVLRQDPAAITPGYLKPDPIGWVGTHRHGPAGENEPYVFTHFFKYRIDLPRGAQALVLPDDESIRVLAASVARRTNDDVQPSGAIIDPPRTTAVSIHSAQWKFIDAASFTLSSPNPGAVIRYALDGSRPTEHSPAYSEPVTISESATVGARAFVPGMDDRFVAQAVFTKCVPRPGSAVTGLEAGLACRYFTGAWDVLPDFTTISPERTSVLAGVAVPEFARAEDIGLELIGYLRAPEEGMYTLHLWSDDGSRMRIGGDLIIDNDGLHGRRAVTAQVALGEGMHPIRVAFFQHLGGVNLELWIEGPGIALQEVPPEMLWHIGGEYGE